MQNWIKVTLLLCFYGLLREIRPSEPFVSEFLIGEWRNITNDQLIQDVYPIGTYSYLSQLLIVFLITDFLRIKPVIIISAVSGICLYTILLWTISLKWLQISQFVYGLYMATEVAYLTYIYAKVDSDKYPEVSSYTRMAALAGRFVSGISGQLLVMFHLMDYRQLNYITFATQILATFWVLWLPPVQYGIYFHRQTTNSTTTQLSINSSVKQPPLREHVSFKSDVRDAAALIARHSRSAYSRPAVVAWSLLYAGSMALFVQAQVYVQLLWIQIQADTETPVAYNGFVEAVQTLLGAGGSFVASLYGRSAVPAASAAVQGAAMFLATYVPSVYVSYAGYVVMGVMYHYTITLASAKIAKQLTDESCFGLIFGINTFLGTGLQSLLTFIMINQLELNILVQYYVISCLFLILSSVWMLGWTVHLCKQKKSVNLTSKYS